LEIRKLKEKNKTIAKRKTIKKIIANGLVGFIKIKKGTVI
jgi:hypothetical protein